MYDAIVVGTRVAGASTAMLLARRVRFDAGSVVLEGAWPAVDGVDALYSPRRTRLDALLVDAARAAGAEVREGFAVDEVLFAGGRRSSRERP